MRQFILVCALALTLLAVLFAPPPQQVDEIIEPEAVPATNSANMESSLEETVKQNISPQIGKRMWVTENSRDLFPSKIKPQPPVYQALLVDLPPPKPTAPPLPFIYIGKVIEDGLPTVFVSKHEKTYLLKGGEILDGTYSVNKVEAEQVVFTYLPLETEQVMNIRGKD